MLIKIHWDYRDPRIRNTEVELDTYEEVVDRLLDQVLDEYGLIVCGWSGEHDKALARALSRSKNHRFATYWTFRGTLSEETRRLAQQRRAELIEIIDADDFFGQVKDACEALADMERHHPLSITAAVAICKRELSGDPRAIPVHDRIRFELARIQALDLIASPKFEGGQAEHISRLTRFEEEIQMVAALIATSSYWGNEESDRW